MSRGSNGARAVRPELLCDGPLVRREGLAHVVDLPYLGGVSGIAWAQRRRWPELVASAQPPGAPGASGRFQRRKESRRRRDPGTEELGWKRRNVRVRTVVRGTCQQ